MEISPPSLSPTKPPTRGAPSPSTSPETWTSSMTVAAEPDALTPFAKIPLPITPPVAASRSTGAASRFKSKTVVSAPIPPIALKSGLVRPKIVNPPPSNVAGVNTFSISTVPEKVLDI